MTRQFRNFQHRFQRFSTTRATPKCNLIDFRAFGSIGANSATCSRKVNRQPGFISYGIHVHSAEHPLGAFESDTCLAIRWWKVHAFSDSAQRWFHCYHVKVGCGYCWANGFLSVQQRNELPWIHVPDSWMEQLSSCSATPTKPIKRVLLDNFRHFV